MKILIVDDETGARETLRLLIESFISGEHQIREAESVPMAVKLIQEESPELVFLDIEMPEYNGFELFNFVPNPTFSVIFSTAYNEYALKAFEVAAVDYLLKPIIAQRLVQAVDKAKERYHLKISSEQLKTFKDLGLQSTFTTSKLAIPVSQGIDFVDKENVLYAKADGSYTRIYLEGREDIYLSKRLSLVEKILSHDCFIRINRSYIINSYHVAHISKSFGGMIRMNDGHEITIPKEKRELLFEKLSFE